jgi:hypothetical protein
MRKNPPDTARITPSMVPFSTNTKEGGDYGIRKAYCRCIDFDGSFLVTPQELEDVPKITRQDAAILFTGRADQVLSEKAGGWGVVAIAASRRSSVDHG